jgi:hypothetical protein
LAALYLLTPPARLIEPAIALSIIYVGADKLAGAGWARCARVDRIRLRVYSCLRLLPTFYAKWTCRAVRWVGLLFSFNLGVEIGQLIVVIAVASAFAALRSAQRVGEKATRLCRLDHRHRSRTFCSFNGSSFLQESKTVPDHQLRNLEIASTVSGLSDCTICPAPLTIMTSEFGINFAPDLRLLNGNEPVFVSPDDECGHLHAVQMTGKFVVRWMFPEQSRRRWLIRDNVRR